MTHLNFYLKRIATLKKQILIELLSNLLFIFYFPRKLKNSIGQIYIMIPIK